MCSGRSPKLDVEEHGSKERVLVVLHQLPDRQISQLLSLIFITLVTTYNLFFSLYHTVFLSQPKRISKLVYGRAEISGKIIGDPPNLKFDF